MIRARQILYLAAIGAFVAVVTALAAWGVVSMLPKRYISVAYLKLDAETANYATVLMKAGPVQDKVMAQVKIEGDTIEARRRKLSAAGQMVQVGSSGLFQLSVVDPDPQRAKDINTELLEAWMSTVKPGPTTKADLEATLERKETLFKASKKGLDNLLPSGNPDALVTRYDLVREGTRDPLLTLLQVYDTSGDAVQKIRRSLDGISRDSVVGTPTLPEEPVDNRGSIVFAVMGAELIFLIAIFVWKNLFDSEHRASNVTSFRSRAAE